MSAADVRALHRQRLARDHAAQSALPFPLAAGDRCEFQASSAGHTAFDGACRVLRPLVAGTDYDAEVGPMYRVMCLNGGARNGQEFDAYESELTK
jgi:hypothetical protein